MAKQLAGYQQLESTTPRNPLHNVQPGSVITLPGGIVIDGTNGIDGGFTRTYDIRAGWWMGQITASGLWVPAKRTQVNGTSGAVTEVVVDNSYPFKGNETITIGGDTGVVVSDVDYSTHTLTIASTTVADNDVVFAEDGSGVVRGVLLDFARLRDLENNKAANVQSVLLTAGDVNSAILLGDTDAIIAAAKAGRADESAEQMYIDDIRVWTGNKRVF